jgi:hypothetical protein
MRPSWTKQIQANVPWIGLVLFVRIGPFQWVTAIPNQDVPPCLRMCLECLKRILSPFSSPAGRLAWREFDPANGKRIAQFSEFGKQLHRLTVRIPASGRFRLSAPVAKLYFQPSPAFPPQGPGWVCVVALATRLGIQVNDHLSCRISRRNWGLQPAAFRLDLTLPFDLLARTSPSAKRRRVAMFLAPWPAR